MSDSLWPHGLQHVRLPCPSLSRSVCSNSCLLNWWCHSTISFSVISFSSCPQAFQASGPFPMSQLFHNRWPKYSSNFLYSNRKLVTNEKWKAVQLLIEDYQFSSVAQSCPTLYDPMNRSTSGLPVHHQLPEFTKTHFHQVGDTIQPSHPLSSPSPPVPNPSQHQSVFQWVNSSHEVAKVLEFQL